MQWQEIALVDDLVEPKRVGLLIIRPFDELRISATTARDRLPVAVSGSPPRSIACRSRVNVLRATAEAAISSASRLLAIRIAVWMADGSCLSALKLSKVSSVQAGSTPSSHFRTCGSCRKSPATMIIPSCRSVLRELILDAATRLASTSAAGPDIAHRDDHCLLLSDQYDQSFAACDARAEQIPLQHGTPAPAIVYATRGSGGKKKQARILIGQVKPGVLLGVLCWLVAWVFGGFALSSIRRTARDKPIHSPLP